MRMDDRRVSMDCELMRWGSMGCSMNCDSMNDSTSCESMSSMPRDSMNDDSVNCDPID